MFRSRVARACALAAVVAVLTAGCGDDDDEPDAAATSTTGADSATTDPSTTAPSSTTTTEEVPVIDVAFAGGQVTGGVRTETVALGETVRLRVTSDVADHVHVHTYDVLADVTPGQPAELEVVATIPGRHEVELEERGRPLLILEVR